MDEKEKRRQRILTEPLIPLLVKTAIPTMVGMMVSLLYNLTDTFFIGTCHDKSMTAAIGVVYAFISMVQAIGFWFGYGSGNAMSRLLGEQEEKEAQAIADVANLFSVVIGILILVLGNLWMEELTAFLGGNASIRLTEYTCQYLKIILIAVPFQLLATTVYNQVRLCGNVKDAMVGLLVGMVVNVILDPLLIMIFQMGIRGAGIATLIGNVVSCIMILFLSYRHGNIPVRFKLGGGNRERIYHILVGGLPNFSRQGITGISTMLLNQVVASYGDSMIAAITISSRIASMGYLLMIGFGQGFQPICGMNYGARQYDRVKKALSLTVVFGSLFMIVSTLGIGLRAESLVCIFTQNEEVISYGISLLHYQCISFPFLALYAIASMFLQNIGEYWKAFWISIARQGLFFIPLMYMLPTVGGEKGVYLLQPTADLLAVCFACILCAGWFSDHSSIFGWKKINNLFK